MNGVLLVAAREFRQIVTTRGFWVMLLVVPLAIAVSQVAGRFAAPPLNVAYVVADATGQYAPAIEHRIDLVHQGRVLGDLSAYAKRWKVDAAAPGAIWAQGRRWFSAPEVEAFVAAGGLAAAQRAIAPRLAPDAPAFTPPPAPYLPAAVPAGVPTDQGPGRFGDALQPWLKGDIATAEGRRPLALAVYIPANFGAPGEPVRMWTNGRPNDVLIEMVRGELTAGLRAKALRTSGLTPGAYARIEAVSAPVVVSAPPAGGGREQVTTRSLLPLALVYLLLMTVMVTGSMMLQGVIEERSNRLLESVLACIRPGQLMYGKLLGLGAIGLTIIATWVAFAMVAAFAVHGAMADFLRPSLASLDQPWIIAALIFYFLAGYLIISMIYLAIGVLSNSMQDAQAYLTPVVMVITLPTVFMMISAVKTPDGVLPRVMSWIPFYTPFAMLARLGGGVSLVEVLGTTAMLIAFVAVELFLLGRLFQASLLRTGQPPKLGAFVKLMFQTQPD
jgi:ABC-2 type transport system permease protein